MYLGTGEYLKANRLPLHDPRHVSLKPLALGSAFRYPKKGSGEFEAGETIRETKSQLTRILFQKGHQGGE